MRANILLAGAAALWLTSSAGGVALAQDAAKEANGGPIPYADLAKKDAEMAKTSAGVAKHKAKIAEHKAKVAASKADTAAKDAAAPSK
jgi:hypothetical protein